MVSKVKICGVIAKRAGTRWLQVTVCGPTRDLYRVSSIARVRDPSPGLYSPDREAPSAGQVGYAIINRFFGIARLEKVTMKRVGQALAPFFERGSH